MFRQSVFAGSWYEGDAKSLTAYLRDVTDKSPILCATTPKFLVMPHAGHRFSGQLAARAAAQLQPGPSRVVIFGPSHRHSFKGVALPGGKGYETPLGKLPLDEELVTKAQAFHEVVSEPLAHGQEHSLEVVLPFIQQKLGNVSILPLVVGTIESSRLRALMQALWGGPETLIVISTDMTHFLTGDEASTADHKTAFQIEAAKSHGLSGQQACGHKALGALLDVANSRGMRLSRLGLLHSGHVTGDHGRVVGYGAWAGHEQESAQLPKNLRTDLLRAARQGLALRLKNGLDPSINVDSFVAPFQGLGASFVTLSINGKLRGCIGSLAAHQPLITDVVKNAVKSGFSDPRFPPIKESELAACEIEIAILGRPAAMSFSSEANLLEQLTPGEDGLILTDGNYRGTFLPKVWESLPTQKIFFKNLKRKAGLPEDHWSDTLRVSRYTTERFSETETHQ